MGTLTIRLPDDKHERLKALASHRNTSINNFMEELSTQAYVDAIDTSRNNVDIFYKYEHIVVNRPWRTEIRAGYTKVVHF